MTTADMTASRSSATLGDYINLLRPHQWVKNVVVLAGPAAGMKLVEVSSLPAVGLTFLAFSLAASAAYAFNDCIDRDADAKHPTKRHRPVASGRISIVGAIGLGSILTIAAIAIPIVWLPKGVVFVILSYIVLTGLYTVALKRQVILDVIVIATGFILRALAGALAVGVPTSEWMMACVFTLCLFMGFGKRRSEIAMIGGEAGEVESSVGEHRRTLLRYTPDLLNHLLTVSAGIAVITFLLYTLDKQGHPSPFHKEHLFYTLPLVVYGIFRFAMLTELGVYTGPTEIVLKDRAMLWTIILWTACAMVVVYQTTFFGPGGLEGVLHLSGVSGG